jgi:PAS domain S-box-containing protein
VELNAGVITFQNRPADLVFVRDITERKRAEAAMRESEERFRRVFAGAPIGIVLTDVRTKPHQITRANAAFCELLGYREDELTELTFMDLTHPDDRAQSREITAELLDGTTPGARIEKRYVTKDGRVIWVTGTVALLRDDEGHPTFGLAMIENITERKEAEEKIQATLAELARSNAELEQFAYAASHDLQEPLRTIAGYVKLLKRRYEGQLDNAAQEFIAYAVDGVGRMQRLIDDLLTYARVGSRAKPFAPFAAGSALRTAMANLQLKIRDTGATITNDDLPVVFGDESQIAQLFQNLLDNALKFRGAEPPHVEVSASRKGGRWIFAVRDNGIGIDPKYFDRIFKVFQRLHTIDQYPGSGIGLAVCERIVRRHGGTIWVESEPGKGTVFHFSLPCEPE